MAYVLINTYGTGAQVYLLKQYSSVTINSGQTLTARNWNGSTGGIIAFLCTGTFSGSGSIDIKGTGFIGGSAVGNNANGLQGEGTTGAGGSASQSANGNGGGGGTGAVSFGAGSGGGGGNATAGTSGGGGGTAGGGGAGGSGVANAGLTVADFGGAGGSGGNFNIASGGSGAGGNGGGFFLVVSKIIDLSSMTVLRVDGNDGNNSSGSGGDHGGGGGGSGGAELLKGQLITLGSNKATALAGAAGTGSGSASAGGAGSLGRVHADYGVSITGTTNPTIDSRQDFTLNDKGNFFFAM